MIEVEMKRLIIAHPEEFIEEGLTFIGREVHVQSGFIDLLFETRHGEILVIEVKRGTLNRDHLGQALDYFGHKKAEHPNKAVQPMLIAQNIRPQFRITLEEFGIDYKLIPLNIFIEVADKYKFQFTKNEPEETKLTSSKGQDRRRTTKSSDPKLDEILTNVTAAFNEHKGTGDVKSRTLSYNENAQPGPHCGECSIGTHIKHSPRWMAIACPSFGNCEDKYKERIAVDNDVKESNGRLIGFLWRAYRCNRISKEELLYVLNAYRKKAGRNLLNSIEELCQK